MNAEKSIDSERLFFEKCEENGEHDVKEHVKERASYQEGEREREGEVRSSSPSAPQNGTGNGHSGKTRRREVREALIYDDSWKDAPWGSIQSLVALYNAMAPKEWPLVQTVSNGLAPKITEYLKQFPNHLWWEETFTRVQESKFIRDYQGGGLSWLLQRGKADQIENCAKVHDGRFL